VSRGYAWTYDELALLHAYYGDLPARELQAIHLPGRSVSAIRSAARAEGLIKQAQRPWTPAEDAMMRELWPQRGLAAQLNRTPATCRARAMHLGLARPTSPWTPADDAALRELWQHQPAAEVAARLGRSAGACRARAGVLGLTRPRPVVAEPSAAELSAAVQDAEQALSSITEALEALQAQQSEARRGLKRARALLLKRQRAAGGGER